MEIPVEAIFVALPVIGGAILAATRLEGKINGLDKELHAFRLASEARDREAEKRLAVQLDCIERDIKRIDAK